MNGEPAIQIPGLHIAFPPRNLSRQASAALLALLTAAAALVVARRLAGALLTPLEPTSLSTALMLIAASAACVRVGMLKRSPTNSFSRLDGAAMAWTSLTAVALAIGLCVRGTPVVWILAAGTCLAVEECWAWPWFLRRKRGWNGFSPVSITASRRTAALETATKTPDPFSGEIVQQLTRRRAADGTEEIFGWLRAPVAPGQRTVSVHVAFCPPMSATPEVVVEQIEGPETRIKTSQRLPYGARIDLKLAAPAEEAANVLLQFSARAPWEG